jgi:hypothetical protein
VASSLARLAASEAGGGAFAAFAAAALSDLMVWLENGLARLSEVSDAERAEADAAAWAALAEEERKRTQAYAATQGARAASYLACAQATLALLNLFAGEAALAQAFLSPAARGAAAFALVHYIELLLGPRCEQLRVATPEKFGFDPRALLLATVELGLRLHVAAPPVGGAPFAHAVAAEDDYSGEMLERCGGVMAKRGLGGVAMQAFVVTTGVSIACLLLYRSGAIRFNQRGAFILWCAVLGIAATYLISFVLSLFGVQTAFISLPTQTGNSSGAMIGLAINAVILIVAALTLVADIQQVDQAVAAGAPESSEWYLAYGLLVSLIWIYLESMKIVFRIAMMFGGGNNRD